MRSRAKPLGRRHSLLVGAAALCLGPIALAQDSTAAAARRLLLEQAQAARQRGAHEEALGHAQRAGRLEMTPSLRLFIAEEELALGRVATALGDADACVREATRDQGASARDAILSRCRDIVAQAQARVARVVLRVPTPAPAGLVVRIGEREVPDTLWGVPYPVDPGPVAVRAEAPARSGFSRTLALREGERVEVEVVLELGTAAAPPAPSASASAVAPPTPSAAPSATPAPPVEAPRGAPLGAWALVGTGGLVSLTTIAWVLLRQSALNTPGCTHDTGANVLLCTPDAAPSAQQGATWETLSFVAPSLGVALVGAGLGWAFSARGASSRAQAGWRVEPTTSGGALRVTF